MDFPARARAAITSCKHSRARGSNGRGTAAAVFEVPMAPTPSRRQAAEPGSNLKKMANADQVLALSGLGEAKAPMRGVCQSFKRVNVLK